MKIGIIGYGRIGRIHYDNVIKHSKVEKVYVATPRPDTIDSTNIDPTSVYGDYKKMIEQETLNGIIICSSTPSHYDVIKACCNKGIDIFCEKPVDLDPDKIAEIASWVDESGILFHVGFNRRCDPHFSSMRDRILMGDVGKVLQMNIISRDPGLPSMKYIKSSGGIFLDMSIHDIDMARHLAQSEVVEVYAKGGVEIDNQLYEYDDVDTVTLVLTFENDVVCTIHNCRKATYGYDQRIEVFGTDGLLKAENVLKSSVQLWNKDGLHSDNLEDFFLERYADSYKIELDNFINAISGINVSAASIDDALKATEIGIAAKQSLKMNSSLQVGCEI